LEKVSIIIPTFNQELFTIKCLESIKKNSFHIPYIIWVDNGSTQESRTVVLDALQSLKLSYLSIFTKHRLGFVKAVNLAMSKVTTNYFCILNNDTEVCKDWDKNLIYPLNQYNSVIASGALTTDSSSDQDVLKMSGRLQPLKNIQHVLLKTKNIESKSAIINSVFTDTEFIEMDKLDFFCIMLKSKVIVEVGKLDEFNGVGYCMKIKKLGLEMVLVPSVYIGNKKEIK